MVQVLSSTCCSCPILTQFVDLDLPRFGRYQLLEGLLGIKWTLAAVLLMHEARICGAGQRLDISQMNVLVVVASAHSIVFRVIAIVCCSLRLLRLYKLFCIIYRSHNVIVARLFHHLWIDHTILTFQLAVCATALVISSVYTRKAGVHTSL